MDIRYAKINEFNNVELVIDQALWQSYPTEEQANYVEFDYDIMPVEFDWHYDGEVFTPPSTPPRTWENANVDAWAAIYGRLSTLSPNLTGPAMIAYIYGNDEGTELTPITNEWKEWLNEVLSNAFLDVEDPDFTIPTLPESTFEDVVNEISGR